MTSPVAGVDGCRGGWCVVRTDAAPCVLAAFADVVALCHDCARVCVDMPIGLAPRRPCDAQARTRLGKRASSIFTPPPREVLGLGWEEVRGFSLQSFNLFRRIAEVDAVMTPTLQERFVETHPELVFTRLLGHPPHFPKRTMEGRAERLALLPQAASARPPRGAAKDDLVDAWALCLAAASPGGRFGGELDERGLRMEIWS